MEVGSVHAAALDALAAASTEPARHVEHGAETATVQSFGRNEAAAPTLRDALAARQGDAGLATTAHAAAEFSLPTEQLVPAALTNLNTQPAWTLLLPPPTTLPPPPEADTTAASRRRESSNDDGEPPDAEDEATTADEENTDDDKADVLDAEPDDDDCEPLSRALQLLLAAPSRATGADRVLAALLDQWQRHRCVVLACPQRIGADGPAWAFVLRLRRNAAPGTGRATGTPPQLSLRGRRVAARLQWRLPPTGVQWLQARLAKEHHPQRGRQLVPLDPAAASLPVDVQLGPVLADRRTRSDVRLRVDAVRRFWGGLGDQWSVLVVVCSLPLVRPAPLAEEIRPETPPGGPS